MFIVLNVACCALLAHYTVVSVFLCGRVKPLTLYLGYQPAACRSVEML